MKDELREENLKHIVWSIQHFFLKSYRAEQSIDESGHENESIVAILIIKTLFPIGKKHPVTRNINKILRVIQLLQLQNQI